MQNKKGISLVVLIIVIIVMIILGGAIIVSLDNTGIFEKADEAVQIANEASVNNIAQLAWAEAYMDGVRAVEDLSNGEKGFKSRIEEALDKNGVDKDKYTIIVTEKGVTVTKKETWKQDGLTVVKGKQIMQIGDTVDYKSGVDEYTGSWKVLGADNEGNLLIVSSIDVKKDHRLGREDTMTTVEEKRAECEKDFQNGITELISICEIYKNGEGALEARSITVEDINKITGYDKSTYQVNAINQYNNIMTYTYNKTDYPSYSGINGVKGTVTSIHSRGFYYYDGTEFKHVENISSGVAGETIAVLTSTGYTYGGKKYLADTEKAYNMLFGTSDNYSSYWLADTYVNTGDYASFGIRRVASGGIEGVRLITSDGFFLYGVNGVRAVVTLSSEIQFTGSSTEGWTY